jgi:hypothetical protein
MKKKILVISVLLALGVVQEVVYADFTFGERVNVETTIPVLEAVYESIFSFSSDGLEMYITSFRPGGHGDNDIWVLRRSSKDDDWGAPQNLGDTINTEEWDGTVSISSDGLTLYFDAERPEGYGAFDIYMATRATRNDPWGPPVNMGPEINGSGFDWIPWISPDGLELYFQSHDRDDGYGGLDLYVARRDTPQDSWQAPTNLGPIVNSPTAEKGVSLSPDGLLLFLGYNAKSTRAGAYGAGDMWMTRRASLSEPWQTPVNLGPEVNSSIPELAPRVSPDGSMLYFYTKHQGTYINWQAPIIPTVDFNGDSRVDIEDLTLLIEHWGENEPAYDMGPMPWGDGIVDVNDLEVFMSHWGEDANFIAHWKLDEAGGDVAYDSAADNDAVVMGDALWQHEAGHVDGALQFDGVTSYLSAPFILDPTKQPFSVYAWVKGGQPGQTIISQHSNFGGEWLALDAAGALISTLTFPLPAITSDAVIADDLWHHIGLISDGAGISSICR